MSPPKAWLCFFMTKHGGIFGPFASEQVPWQLFFVSFFVLSCLFPPIRSPAPPKMNGFVAFGRCNESQVLMFPKESPQHVAVRNRALVRDHTNFLVQNCQRFTATESRLSEYNRHGFANPISVQHAIFQCRLGWFCRAPCHA